MGNRWLKYAFAASLSLCLMYLLIGNTPREIYGAAGDKATLGYDAARSTDVWRVSDVGDILPGSDNNYNVGLSTARVRNLYIGTSITNDGSVTQTGAATFSGNVTLGDALSDTLTINGSSTTIPVNYGVRIATAVNAGATSILRLNGANQRVGINQDTPATSLDVSGSVTLGSTNVGTQIVDLKVSSATIGEAYGLRFSTASNAGATAILFLDGINKRVGMGTETPSSTLEMGGVLTLWSRTSAQISSLAGVVGGLVRNSSTNGVCLATGTAAGAWVSMSTAAAWGGLLVPCY